MKTLAASLLTHQKGSNRSPYVQVTATAKKGGSHLLRWTRWYTGGESDTPHAATVANDGSLIRVRNNAGDLRVSVVAAPAIDSVYTSSGSLAVGLVVGSGVAIASSSTEVIVAYTRGTSLYVRTSANNGVTWTAEALLFNEGAAVGFIGLGIRQSNSDACLFYSVGANLKRARRTAAVWAGAGTAWTNTMATITGVSAIHDAFDYLVAITGTQTTALTRRVYTAQMGDLALPINVWGALNSVQESDVASTTTFHGPHLTLLTGTDYRLAFSAREAGLAAYNRAFETHIPNANTPAQQWSTPSPHEVVTQHGLALAFRPGSGATNVYATTPSGVWNATIAGTSDLSSRLRFARVRLAAASGKLVADFDNSDALLFAVPSAAMPGLLVGGTLLLQPGYRSGVVGAPEYGVGWSFTVDAIRQKLSPRSDSSQRARTTTVEASGPLDQLRDFHNPQDWQVAAGALTRFAIADRIAGRAGFRVLNSSPSADWTAQVPSFAVSQGVASATALAQLLATVDDQVRHDEGTLTITSVPFTGTGSPPAAVYAYVAPDTAGQHQLVALELVDAPPGVNWLVAQGPDRYAFDSDPASVYQHGPRRRWLRSLAATSDALAIATADNALDRELALDTAAILTVPFNAGQELYDVIDLTYPDLGLAAATRFRVIGIALDYDRTSKRPAYTNTLTLARP